ncbi:MAG: hypothetical protein K0B37_10245 [Bacteroidales bacterium]|nr:hypothetical protein [Bacteroidales bacterium]
MKKALIALTLIFTLGFVNIFQAQTNEIAVDTVKYLYCELMGIQKILSNKVTVTVDFGEERKFFQDSRMRDEETGKVQSFNSMVDALNYMGEKGWEFVQAYVVTSGSQNVYHWLLKKKMGKQPKME